MPPALPRPYLVQAQHPGSLPQDPAHGFQSRHISTPTALRGTQCRTNLKQHHGVLRHHHLQNRRPLSNYAYGSSTGAVNAIPM